MEDHAVLWIQHESHAPERRCEVVLVAEGEFELRVWSGPDLIVREIFSDEPAMLDRAAALSKQTQGAGR